jgi:transmembrane sensor
MESQNYTEIKNLLSKYGDKAFTDIEVEKLSSLLEKPENEGAFSDALYSLLDEFDENQQPGKLVDFDQIKKDILTIIKFHESVESENRIITEKNKKHSILTWVASAAAVFIIAFTLGKIIPLGANNMSPVLSKTMSTNEVRTPFGAITEVTLSDGTHVMLNAGSVIKYNNNYNISDRDIYLEGEAYFKVAPNKELPLIVKVGNINIKAVGTEFNIKAYEDEGVIETTLIEGVVEISKTRISGKSEKIFHLEPNQKAIYIKKLDLASINSIKEVDPSAVQSAKMNDEQMLISPKVDVGQIVAWTQNKLIIKSENLENLSVKLHRKYDVNIIFKDNSIKFYRVSATLENEPIEQVLDALKLTVPIDFRIDGKNVLLFSKMD